MNFVVKSFVLTKNGEYSENYLLKFVAIEVEITCFPADVLKVKNWP